VISFGKTGRLVYYQANGVAPFIVSPISDSAALIDPDNRRGADIRPEDVVRFVAEQDTRLERRLKKG